MSENLITITESNEFFVPVTQEFKSYIVVDVPKEYDTKEEALLWIKNNIYTDDILTNINCNEEFIDLYIKPKDEEYSKFLK